MTWAILTASGVATMLSLVIPTLEASGLLPPGRFRTTVDEVEARFVTSAEFASSATREDVWQNFLELVALIKKLRVRVPAAWIGGSFTTASLDPPDADVSILIDRSKISSTDTYPKVLRLVGNTKKQGLALDAFVIQWWPEGDDTRIPSGYLLERGKWDDFWQRHVPKAERVPAQRHHAMPVRGYLEVILDGYS